MTRRFFKIRAKNAFVKSLEARGITPTVKLDYQLAGYHGQGPTKTVYTVDWAGPSRKNPTKAQKRPTKLQRLMASTKRGKQKRMAKALSAYMKARNPGTKYAGAKVMKNPGGSITIIPIKLRRAK